MIRAVFFDLDGTLIDSASAWRRCVGDFLARHAANCPPEDVAAFQVWVAVRAANPFIGRRGIARRLARALPGLGMSAASIDADLASRLPEFVEPDPRVLPFLAELAPRYRTAILSNGSSRVQRAKLGRAGLAGGVGRVFISGELGVRKPEPEIFLRALAWAGVEPGEALMVGDNPYEDIFGAQRVGFRTCSVWTRKNQNWPDPDWTVSHVTELAAILG